MAVDPHAAQLRASPHTYALLALTAAVLALGAVAIMFLYPSGTSGIDQTFLAGAASKFAPGSVTYFEQQHFYLVRLTSGEFLAVYDVDPRQQTFPRPPGAPLCRVKWYPNEFAQFAAGVDEPGIEGDLRTGVFREPCHGSTFSASGARLFGPSPAGLDTFPVSAGEYVHVNLARRVCTPYSDTVARVFGERSCESNRSP